MVSAKTGNPMGRPRKAAALKVLHGDRDAGQVAGAVPQGDPAAPPEYLTVEGRKLWDAVAPELTDLRILGQSDVPAFVELLESMVLARDIRGRIREHLDAKELAGQEGRRSAVYEYRALMFVISSGWSQFGLTPSARARIFQAVNGIGGASGGKSNVASEDLLSS